MKEDADYFDGSTIEIFQNNEIARKLEEVKEEDEINSELLEDRVHHQNGIRFMFLNLKVGVSRLNILSYYLMWSNVSMLLIIKSSTTAYLLIAHYGIP